VQPQSNGGSTRSVHVVVTCTNRKTKPVPPALHLRNVVGGDVAASARAWISRLEGASVPTVSASELYAGEHWTVARQIPAHPHGGTQVQLWVCSAGYGLIPAETPIRPYAATFTAGHKDSIPGDDAGRSWWKALGAWKGPAPQSPHSMQTLVEADPRALFVLALSPPYVRACQDDVLAAIGSLADSDQLMVVSVGTRGGALADYVVPADARLQAHLGGTRQALNARIAAHLVSRGIVNRTQAVEDLTALLAAQPPIPRYDRKKLSDKEVFTLINEAFVRSPGISASRLLRELRDDGYACEQQRFGLLFRTFVQARS
jgi:hypothetical protein